MEPVGLPTIFGPTTMEDSISPSSTERKRFARHTNNNYGASGGTRHGDQATPAAWVCPGQGRSRTVLLAAWSRMALTGYNSSTRTSDVAPSHATPKTTVIHLIRANG